MALQQEMVAQGNVLFRYRGVLPILIIIPALAIRYFGISDPWLQSHVQTLSYVAYIISLAGLLLRFVVVGYAPPRTSGRNTQDQIADSLSSTGLYSVVRHPLYLGNFLMWLGPAMLTLNSWFVGSFILMYWLYYERIMLAEEDYLRNKFKEAYETWAAGRPAFIPNFSKWVPYQRDFLFYKALYQEKTGFLWLNLIFWLFLALPVSSFVSAFTEISIWTGLLLFSVLMYILLKLIGRPTTVSN